MSLRLEQVAAFVYELSALLELGFPLTEALGRLLPVAPGAVRPVIEDAIEELKKGGQFSLALERQQMPTTLVATVKASEGTDGFPAALRQVAELLEAASARRTSLSLALFYPALVLILMVLLTWFLMGFIGPTLANLLVNFEGMSSLPTKVFVQLVFIFSSPLMIPVLGGLCYLIWVILNGQGNWDRIRYATPVLGRWLVRHETVLWFYNLDHLLKVGLPAPEAARQAALGASANFRAEIEQAADKMDQGSALSQALEVSVPRFPKLAIWMLEKSESKGLEGLARIGDVLDRELDFIYDQGVVVIEPIALLLLGFGVGFIILSVFLPLYQLLGNLG